MPDQPTGTECDGVVAMEAFASQPDIAGSHLALDASAGLHALKPAHRRSLVTAPLKGTDPCRSASSQTLSVT